MTIPKHLMEAKLCNKDTCAEVEQLNNLVNSCQEEIRRLKEEIKIKDGIHETTFKNLMKERKENQRLNNVLNELKKDLQEAFNELQPNELINGRNLIENILNELKESDK